MREYGVPCPPTRRLTRAICGLALGAALIAAGPIAAPASAEDGSGQGAGSQIDASRARLTNLSAKSQEAVLALEKTQGLLAQAKVNLASAEVAATAAQARSTQLEGQLAAAKKEEAAGVARIAVIQAQREKNTDIRNNIARQAYEGSGMERLAVILNTTKAQDLADHMYVAEKVNDNQNAVLTELATLRAAAEDEQRKLEESRRQTATLALQAEAAVAQAHAARAEASSTRSDLSALEQTQKSQAAAVAAQRVEEQSRYDELQAESARIQAQLAARVTAPGSAGVSSAGPQRATGRFAVPVSGPFTSEFGYRVNPVLFSSELHAGLDIGADCGSPVYASGAGAIIRAAWTGGYGNEIIIDHGGGVASTYNHMSAYVRTSGDVKQGDLIGRVGTTGQSTGCHMHWEVRVNGVPVNPRGWF